MLAMNSVASRVRTTEGKFTLESFLSRADLGTECIDDTKLDPRIQLGKNGIQFTGGKYDSPAVEAVAVCHFDEGAKSLGLKGTSSYSAYYAANAVSVASQLWKDRASSTTQSMPLVEFNLSGMGVDKRKLEDTGLDLGGTAGVFNFIDRSHGRRVPISVVQTGDASSKRQPDSTPERAPMLADNPSHSDFATFTTRQQVNPMFADPFQEQERREKEAREKEDRYRENGRSDDERFRKADEAREPRNVGNPGTRENDGVQSEPSVSLGSPQRDRAYAALKAGDSDEVGRIAVDFSQSPRGQDLIERGNQLLAQQQALESQQLLEQSRQLEQQRESDRQHSGPVMSLMQPAPHPHH